MVNIPWCHECGNPEALCACLPPTPIKKTAEPEHIATDVYSETANAEHVPAVPADVQGEPGVAAWLTTDKHGAESATIYPITDGDRSLGWRDEALIRLSDYQRLAAENERVIEALNRQLTEQFELSTKYVALHQAAEGKLAEAVKVLQPFAVHADAYDHPSEKDGDTIAGVVSLSSGKRNKITVGMLRAARTFLASLTSPPTEQGET